MDTTLARPPRPGRRGRRASARWGCSSGCGGPAGRAALLWHNTYLADDRAPGYGRSGRTCSTSSPGAGPSSAPPGRAAPPPPGAPLAGRRILHLTSVHRPRDVRIFHKEARRGGGGRRAGVGRRPARADRARAPPGGRVAPGPRGPPPRGRPLPRPRPRAAPGRALARPPEPAAGRLRRPRVPRRDGPHQALAAAAAARCPSPSPPSAPSGRAARRLAAVVAANEDLAARFAAPARGP